MDGKLWRFSRNGLAIVGLFSILAAGDVVLSLLNIGEDANRIDMRWKANRLLVITYPAQASVEYSVSKTRGIIVELMAE